MREARRAETEGESLSLSALPLLMLLMVPLLVVWSGLLLEWLRAKRIC